MASLLQTVIRAIHSTAQGLAVIKDIEYDENMEDRSVVSRCELGVNVPVIRQLRNRQKSNVTCKRSRFPQCSVPAYLPTKAPYNPVYSRSLSTLNENANRRADNESKSLGTGWNNNLVCLDVTKTTNCDNHLGKNKPKVSRSFDSNWHLKNGSQSIVKLVNDNADVNSDACMSTADLRDIASRHKTDSPQKLCHSGKSSSSLSQHDDLQSMGITERNSNLTAVSSKRRLKIDAKNVKHGHGSSNSSYTIDPLSDMTIYYSFADNATPVGRIPEKDTKTDGKLCLNDNDLENGRERNGFNTEKNNSISTVSLTDQVLSDISNSDYSECESKTNVHGTQKQTFDKNFAHVFNAKSDRRMIKIRLPKTENNLEMQNAEISSQKSGSNRRKRHWKSSTVHKSMSFSEGLHLSKIQEKLLTLDRDIKECREITNNTACEFVKLQKDSARVAEKVTSVRNSVKSTIKEIDKIAYLDDLIEHLNEMNSNIVLQPFFIDIGATETAV